VNALEVKDLTKYYGKSRGIEKVNLRVQEGEIFGFIGPNGAGKTTTIRLILRLIFPNHGTIKIFEKDLREYGEELRNEIGYIPGEVNFYPEVTVKDFLEYTARFYKTAEKSYVEKLCRNFSIDVKKRFRELSMGNKKKVAIVQALMHKPKLLILDEPTNGLDPLIQNLLFEILKEERKKGVTVFFSSHILSEVEKLCDRVALIKDGKILRTEKIDDLMKQKYKIVKLKTDENPSTLKNVLQIKDFKSENGTTSFIYYGLIGDLIKKLSGLKVNDLWIEDPSLEEIFISYYKEESK